jgi:hypothetical protein
VSAVDEKTPERTRARDDAFWAKPVDRLATTATPSAIDLVKGRRVLGAAAGFGRLWQKTFRVGLSGAAVTPTEVVRVWKERFDDFWPKGQRMFLAASGVAPGEVGLINATLPGAPTMATGIMVIYADDESFSFLAPEGHPFAGPITFSAFAEDGVTVAQVHELTRASDPLWELMMMTPVLGRRMQNDLWRSTLRSLARHFGVTAEPDVRVVCVDPRRQWRYATKIVYNAGIRSTIHATTAPLRWLARAFRRA